MPTLTKTLFLLGRQCQKRFWLATHGVEEPCQEGAEDSFVQQEAARVEGMAEQLFPGVVRIAGAKGEREARTLQAMAVGTVAQAALEVDGLSAVVDILERRADGWFLWEVKASTAEDAETDIESLFAWDLAFQWHVLAVAGVSVIGAGVVRLRKAFVRGVAEPAASELLTRIDGTSAVRERLGEVASIVERLRAIVLGPEPHEWPRARCTKSRDAKGGDRPSDCGHLLPTGRCGAQLPATWAGHLPRLQGKLAERVHEVPNRDMRDLPLDGDEWSWSDLQRRVLTCTKSGQPFVDHEAIRRGLATLRWPVAYVDFEFDTQVGIPQFVGARPYDHIPFQWAMRIQERPGVILGDTRSFLHEQATDPRRAFAESLLAALPRSGSVVVHHIGAEKTVLERLAEHFGGRVAADLLAVVDRLVDTEKLAKDGYYHPDQLGSWSIKKLAPCLTGRGYDDLEIQNGMMAVVAWRRLVDAPTPAAERARLRRWLIEYCGRDAVLMHEVLEALRRCVSLE